MRLKPKMRKSLFPFLMLAMLVTALFIPFVSNVEAIGYGYFGYNGAPSGAGETITNIIHFTNFTLSRTAIINNITAKTCSQSGNTNIRFAIYYQSNRTLIASTVQGDATGIAPVGAWVTLAFSSPPTIPAGNYQLAAWGNIAPPGDTSAVLNVTTGTSNQMPYLSLAYGSYPASYTPTGYHSSKGCIYANYSYITVPDVDTDDASGIGSTNATLWGTLNDDGGGNTSVRFQYGLTPAYGSLTPVMYKTSGQSFSANVGSLQMGELYYYRAMATNSNTTVYGTGETFTTLRLYVSAHSPDNSSLSYTAPISLDVTVGDYAGYPVNVTYHLVRKEDVPIGDNTWHEIANATTASFSPPHSFSVLLSSLISSICPSIKVMYAWYITATDMNGSHDFPDNSTNATYIGGQSHDVGINHYVWWLNITAHPSSVTMNYPTTKVYTKNEWRTNHRLNFTISNPDSALMDVEMTIEVPWVTGLLGAKYIVYKPLLSQVPNGTYDVDLSDYIWYANVNYTISVHVYSLGDLCGGGFVVWSGNDTAIFSIGSPALAKKYHVAIRNCLPADGNMTAYTYLNQGISYDVRCNDSLTLYAFLADENTKQLGWNDYSTAKPCPDWYVTVGWERIYTFKYLLQLHEKYTFYLGVAGSHYADTQFDMLYDDSVVYIGKFAQNQSLTIPPVLYLTEKWNFWDPHQCTGVRAVFCTATSLDEGDNLMNGILDTSAFGDQTGNGGGDQYVDPLSNIGFGYMGVIAGLLVILGISLIPFFITKTMPPSMIQMMFTGFGSILAFKFGFLPLWIFIVACLLMLLFLFYKVWGWIKTSPVYTPFVDQGKASVMTGLRAAKTVHGARSGFGGDTGTRERIGGGIRGAMKAMGREGKQYFTKRGRWAK